MAYVHNTSLQCVLRFYLPIYKLFFSACLCITSSFFVTMEKEKNFQNYLFKWELLMATPQSGF